MGFRTSTCNDRETSAILNLIPNGHGRAQSHAHQPLVRMSNTYVEAGTRESEEIFEGIKHGLRMVGDKGGEVDVATGSFTFGAKEGYMIENGELKNLPQGRGPLGELAGGS